MGKEQRTMCLSQPSSLMQTSLWYILDAKERVENLMAEVFDEQEIWKEGDYLLYTELLKNIWNRLNDWLVGSMRENVKITHRAWLNKSNWGCYFNTLRLCDEDFQQESEIDLNVTSLLVYFIKCCERYNTRKLIKKMKLEPNMRYRTLSDKLIKAQKLLFLNEDDEDTYREYATEDGKKRYVWRPQIEAAYHPFIEMEHIDY